MKNKTEQESTLKKEKINKEIAEKLYQEKEKKLKEEKPEEKELFLKKERIIKEKLEEEILKIKLNPTLTDEAKKKAVQIKSLNEKEKLEYLLDMAKTNGVAFAVTVAKKMNDPYILDIFHDILAREGLYKKFKK
jgi:hypothetical protein